MKYCLDLIGAIILAYGVIYTERKILRDVSDVSKASKYKLIFYTIILAISMLINKSFMDNLITPVTTFLIFIILFKIIFKEPLSKIIISAFLTLIISCIAEIIWGCIAMFIFHLQVTIVAEKIYGVCLINSVIGIIMIFLSWLIRKVIVKELIVSNHNGNLPIYLFYFLIIISLSFVIIKHFHDGIYDAMVFADYFIIFLLCAGIILILKEREERTKISKDYDLLREYVESTEGILENYRKANHENKNQLVAIHAMIEEKDPDIKEYVESLLNEKMPSEVEIINNLVSIPLGGLKGLMYHKICKMKDLGIKVKISIISTKKKNVKIPVETSKNLFKIMGVYLDNACEASIQSKEKEVTIEGYFTDRELSFAITNSCLVLPDIDKMDNAGYTTKEKGHGYGLSLVKDILNNDATLSQRREIEGNQYTQYLDVQTK